MLRAACSQTIAGNLHGLCQGCQVELVAIHSDCIFQMPRLY